MKVLIDLSFKTIEELITIKQNLEKLGHSSKSPPDDLEGTIEWLIDFWNDH